MSRPSAPVREQRAKPSKPKTSARRVTGNSKPRKKAGKRRAQRSETPTLPGYVFVEHGAGWKVFRVTYRDPLPGRKWKRKGRRYETHLTNKDVEDGKGLFECLKNLSALLPAAEGKQAARLIERVITILSGEAGADDPESPALLAKVAEVIRS